MARTLELDTIKFPSASNGTNITLQDGLTKFNNVDVDINGGNIDGTPIGANATSTGAFTTISGTLANGVTATTQANTDNSTKVATTAYVKSVVTQEDLDIAGDNSSTGSVDLDSQSLSVLGTADEIVTAASGQTITISLPATINADTTGNAATATSATSATNATNASKVDLNDESTDETCFVTFSTAATGDQALKTGTNLKFDSANGILTATTFSGGLAASSLTGTLNMARIGANAITSGKLKNYVAASGSDPAEDGAVVTSVITDGAVTADKIGASAVTSAKINSGAVTTAKISGANVTYAKIQNVADARILGNNSGAAASVSELTGATVTSMLSNFAYDSSTPANSTKGLVPKPGTAGDNAKYLKGDGTWTDPLVGASFPADITVNGITVGRGNNNIQYNTVFGAGAGVSLSTSASSSQDNTLIGNRAGEDITTGSSNVAVGYLAMIKNSIGGSNTAVGYFAGGAIYEGSHNTAIGYNAGLGGATGATGAKNTAVGSSAMMIGAMRGYYNTAVGMDALMDTFSNHNAPAYQPVQDAQNLTAVGYQAGTSYAPSGNLSNKQNIICLGDNNVTTLYCKVNTISTSDERDKTDITSFSHGLDWIKKMNPVTYRWDHRSSYLPEELEEGEVADIENVIRDGSKKLPKLHLGLIGQEMMEIEKADGFSNDRNDQLIVNQNEDGKTLGIGYSNIIPVLINAVKELSSQVDTLTAKVTALEA